MISAPSPTPPSKAQPSRLVGRYVMYDEIASGGMASVHFGRMRGAVGFSRTVAIKSLHPHFAHDAEFISMFLDEVRLVSRIKHPNVAAPLDVVLIEQSAELFLIMEYIHGETLACLLQGAILANVTVPPAVSASIMSGALRGLHAAHEATDELGAPLNIVHRDVSPHNIMVGVDGVPRVLDFGVAKAVSRSQATSQGQLKGKVAYMAPEQLGASPIDRRADIFAAGIVLWEALTLRRLFVADDAVGIIGRVQMAPIDRPGASNPRVSQALDQVVLKALNRDVNLRFQTAQDFADAIEEAVALPSTRKMSEWVAYLGGQHLTEASARLSAIESSSFEEDTLGPSVEGQRPQSPDRRVRPVIMRPATYSEVTAVAEPVRGGKHEGVMRTSTSILLARGLSWGRRHWPVLAGAAILMLITVVGVVSSVRASHLAEVKTTVNSRQAAQPALAARALPAPKDLDQPSLGTTAVLAESNPRPSTIPRPASPQTTAQSSATHRKTKKDCNPPFFFDGKGIRRVKPQCL
jgi:eukaryotic-like serine/threonine-protein kinase